MEFMLRDIKWYNGDRLHRIVYYLQQSDIHLPVNLDSNAIVN